MTGELLRRATRGETSAVEAVVRRCQKVVYAVVGRMLVGRPELVEDLAQDAFLRILDRLPRYDPDGRARFTSWAATIAVQACIDRLRVLERRRRHVVHLDPEDELPPLHDALAAPREDPERAAARRELERRIARAMAALPAEQRAALVLRAYHDLDYDEIARATGATVASVKSRLFRARAALRRAMGKTEEGVHG